MIDKTTLILILTISGKNTLFLRQRLSEKNFKNETSIFAV